MLLNLLTNNIMDYPFNYQCKLINCAKLIAPFNGSVNLIILLLLTCSQQLIQRTETSNLPLLSASLRTFQAHACDGQQLMLECLPNTVINIYLVNYGRTAGPSDSSSANLCQQSSSSNTNTNQHQLSASSSLSSSSSPSLLLSTSPSSSSSSSSHVDVSSPLNPSKMIAATSSSSYHDDDDDNNNQTKPINQTAIHSKPDCQTTDNLKYSLLNKVEGACREQQICKIMTDPKLFGGIDPCPGITKYAEVAYKCRPNTFYNKIVCEDNRMRLSCKKYHRIMIYSAFFGSTKTGVPECPQASSSASSKGNNHEDCSISLTTEKVVAVCNGLRTCELMANRQTFDKPGCHESTKLYLKIAYACVRHEVLKSSIGKSSSSSGSPAGGGNEMIYPDEKLNGSSIKSSSSTSTVDYSGYMGAPRVAPEDEDKDSSSVISSESYLKSKEPLNDPIRVPIKDGLGARSSGDSDDPYLHGAVDIVDANSNKSTLFHPKKALGFMVDWLSAYKFIKDKAEMIIVCLIMSIVVATLLFLVFLSTNQLIIQRLGLGKSMVASKGYKKSSSSCSPKHKKSHHGPSSPFSKMSSKGGGSRGCDEIDGLDDTTVDQLLEELDPVLVHSMGPSHGPDPLSNLTSLTSSHHSFHDFRAHSKPLITDGLPYPASSGQTLSFTSSLSRGSGNRLSFGRPIQPPTAPMTIITPMPMPMPMTVTPINSNNISNNSNNHHSINCHHQQLDSSPRAMAGTVNSYF